MAEPGRLDDAALGRLLGRADELLGQVESIAGPTAQTAMAAVQALTGIYGEALARVLDLADGRLADRLAGDRLLGHLLVLHGIHPEPVERRVARALDAVRPVLGERGAEVELAGIEDGTAAVRLTGGGCGAAALEDAVREAVLAAAPELSAVRRLPAGPSPLIPAETLLRRPVAAEGAA